MTFTFRSETIDGVTIAIEQEKFCKAYEVVAYYGGMPLVPRRYYETMKQATQRYNYLKRKANDGTI